MSKQKKKKKNVWIGIRYVKFEDKKRKPSSAKEEIGLKNLYSNDEWWAKDVD